MRRAVQDSNAADLLIDLPGAYHAVRVALMPAESSCLTQPAGWSPTRSCRHCTGPDRRLINDPSRDRAMPYPTANPLLVAEDERRGVRGRMGQPSVRAGSVLQ
jgi:hypothetical protein